MPCRVSRALTSLSVKNAKPGRHADGDGLYLLVTDTGARSWFFRYMLDGKARDLGLSRCPEAIAMLKRSGGEDLTLAHPHHIKPLQHGRNGLTLVNASLPLVCVRILAQGGFEVLNYADVIDHQTSGLIPEDAVHKGNGLHQAMTFHRLVDIHCVHRRGIKPRQPLFSREVMNVWLTLWGEIANNPILRVEHSARYNEYGESIVAALREAAPASSITDVEATASAFICLVDGLGVQRCVEPEFLSESAARATCWALLSPHLTVCKNPLSDVK